MFFNSQLTTHKSKIFLILLFLPFLATPVQAEEEWTGRRIMEEAFQRHQLFPYVYEEQTMILMDGAGNRDVRKARRFSRVEKDGTVKYLLVFDNPVEVRGVALLATHEESKAGESWVYLPAFGKELKSSAGENRGGAFLGTDFAIEDLAAEVLSDFRYSRTDDARIGKINYYVVKAFPRNKEIERATGYNLRRHFIRKDNLYVVRTDYYDRRGRFLKRQTHHDLKRVNGDMFRANMILMENHKERHKTLIKINRRVFSNDYVPPEMFTSNWLFENRHIKGVERSFFEKVSKDGGEGETEKE